MALTPEIQAQVDMQTEIENLRHAHVLELETKRQQTESQRAKVELVRLAQQTLLANSNNQPVSDRQVSAADITTFADTLVNYINA
jgi:phosphoribosylformylglycinamidine (FGAM) synthase PurS component